MTRFIRMVFGALVVFMIFGGVSALPIATRGMARLSAQQVPASLEAFQAVPKKYRQDVLAAMTPEAIAAIAQQHWNMLLAQPDTSAELKAILHRLKGVHTAARIVKAHEVMKAYQAEHRKWRAGERADEPVLSDGYEPEVWAVLQAIELLPQEDQAKLNYMNLPEIQKEESPVSFWFGTTEWLKESLGPVSLIASVEACRCKAVEIGPMPCNDWWCGQILGWDMYCERGCDGYVYMCPPYEPCNGVCRSCY
jgi:hypothetical protein